MMYSQERLRANIRGLRKAFGETQEQLGIVIGASHTAVSNYEKGVREVDHYVLDAIAKHYGVTLDELIYGDWTFIGKKPFEKNDIWRSPYFLYPIVSSEKALKNEFFKRAYDAQKEMFKQMSRFNIDALDNVDKIFDCYETASEDSSAVLESTANLVPMYLILLGINHLSPDFVLNPPAGVRLLIRADKQYGKLFDSLEEEPEVESDEETLEFLRDLDREVTRAITALKRSRNWSELADYYLALRYFLGVGDNSLGLELNIRIGVSMLSAFESVKNPYAMRFFSGFRNKE